ncbi:MAG: class I SAM-dependent methyltransferase [Candidatus Sumerlaeota bacterium]|nr:class I SAM-dependent methyltransferase [Candidatus Sumerlaeota bacterium]
MCDQDILDEQIRYYRARAGEYDEWFLRLGRYDRGEEHRAEWFADVAEAAAALERAKPSGDMLELACGTGLWTQRLAPAAARLTAVDASPETLQINRERVRSDRVEYVQADIFRWRPDRKYDFVFFGFWLSHVPEARFEGFWRMVGEAVKPGGTVFFVDSAFEPESTYKGHRIERAPDGVMERKLNDGRQFRVVKIYYEPEPFMKRLARLGWEGAAARTRRFFVYGCVHPRMD